MESLRACGWSLQSCEYKAGSAPKRRHTPCPISFGLTFPQETKEKPNQPNEMYNTRSRINKAVITIITPMILLLLILPIYLLLCLMAC